MPELPEVETTRRGIYPHICQQKVTNVKINRSDLRWPVPEDMPQLILDSVLQDVERRGKYLLLKFESGTALIHLGMSGSIRILEQQAPARKHDHFEIHFANDRILRFNDPRRFGAFLWAGREPCQHKLLVSLGVEPLDESFNAEYIFQVSRKRKIAVKQFIMDAKVVVGVGNIYANEALFLAGIHPQRSANRISYRRYQLLVSTIKEVLEKAIEQGGTTLKDYIGADGNPGYFEQCLNVYGRGGQHCLQCNDLLSEIRQSGRTTVYCKNCQS